MISRDILTSELLSKPRQRWRLHFLHGLPFGRKSWFLWWSPGGLGGISSLGKGPGYPGVTPASWGEKAPLPGVSFVLVQELLMQHTSSHIPLPWQGLCARLAGEHHSSSRSGQALLAVKSLGIACRKCRMYSVSPADVKITCETRS